MVIKPILLKFVKKTSKEHALIITITVKKSWNTFDGKKILLLTNENFKYVKLVKRLIPKQLSHFEWFFLKKKLTHIILLKLKHDVILKLINNFPAFKLLKYKTFIKYIL